ncbi:PqqD family protein [Crocosphaera sp.]|uniref:PqqD family protein n=1 Tax=Crocosphaera sp. TaxID=2729996 RepID=UPI00261860B2|nr:PqqD family protein [Crocosphaera sp.]MDJ0581308.1 PqqD family protein [Crocosphaera sp.]
MSERYQINSPNVVHETLDGEVVIIHLEQGTYYSFLKSGIDIWSGIERELSVDQLTEELCQKYEGESSTIRLAIEQFLTRLKEEDLITVSNLKTLKETTTLEQAKSNEKTIFEEPLLEVYTDMQDLLLLDPIHEVSDEGWPNAKMDDVA